MRILLVEDNAALAQSIKDALTAMHYAVDVVHDGVAADTVLSTEDYAVVLLDLGLPRLSGLEVLQRFRKRGRREPVLILTAQGSVEDRIRGLDAGADDYLPKPFDLNELEARLRALLRRSQGVSTSDVALGSLVLDSKRRVFRLDDTPLSLTPREFAVLEVLFLKAGKTVSKEQLLEQICTFDDSLSLDAIEIYVHRLRKKLEGSGVAIVTLRGLGYLLEASGDPA